MCPDAVRCKTKPTTNTVETPATDDNVTKMLLTPAPTNKTRDVIEALDVGRYAY